MLKCFFYQFHLMYLIHQLQYDKINVLLIAVVICHNIVFKMDERWHIKWEKGERATAFMDKKDLEPYALELIDIYVLQWYHDNKKNPKWRA